MEIKNRSVIFKADELNVVDMATGGQVADRYIQMASDIIFHNDGEQHESVIRLAEPGFSEVRDTGLLHKENMGPRLIA
jgi:hypothetical protein